MKKTVIVSLLLLVCLAQYSQKVITHGAKVVVFNTNALGIVDYSNMWLPGTGRFDIVNDTVLECITTGTTSKKSEQVYGEWIFDFNKVGLSTFINILLIWTDQSGSINSPTAQGYWLQFSNTEVFYFGNNNFGSFNTLFNTTSAYIGTGTWYTNKLNRSGLGVFSDSIKGGSFGSGYVLVDVSGGSGTNPVTDNSFTVSNYMVLDFDAGDLYSDVNIKAGQGLYWTDFQLDAYLKDLVNFYTTTPPTSDLTLNMLGNRFPIPTNGALNTYLQHLTVIFDNEALTFTYYINS